MTSRVASLSRFLLSAFTLALGVSDLAQCAIGSLADQALPFVRRGIKVAVGVVLFVLLGSL